MCFHVLITTRRSETQGIATNRDESRRIATNIAFRYIEFCEKICLEMERALVNEEENAVYGLTSRETRNWDVANKFETMRTRETGGWHWEDYPWVEDTVNGFDL